MLTRLPSRRILGGSFIDMGVVANFGVILGKCAMSREKTIEDNSGFDEKRTSPYLFNKQISSF
ncbi:hypothetical protein M832_07490 [Chlamydia avium 10DC88]|uniref:Uncharacterized protein n=1 Tax=Chlamydia avium 10DC88 TaxID=1229831 RepID=W8JHD6_9CHLA|nr:hypothetical protein M832_07490 [Chlamydia avium 10DC88]